MRYALMTGRIIADGALLVASFIIAYWLRYGLQLGRDVIPESYLPLSAFTTYIAAYVAITLVTFNMRGLYALPRGASWFEHMRIIGSGALIGVALRDCERRRRFAGAAARRNADARLRVRAARAERCEGTRQESSRQSRVRLA